MTENFSLSPPLRFGMVNPGVYRGAYPVLPNFRFLYQLKLKTIISLTPEPPIEDLRLFGENAGINIVHFPISRTGPLSNELFAQLCQVVQLCVDSSNFPIYIHCLDGRRIMSVFVLMLRKVQAWNPVSSFTEYWRFVRDKFHGIAPLLILNSCSQIPSVVQVPAADGRDREDNERSREVPERVHRGVAGRQRAYVRDTACPVYISNPHPLY